MTGTVPPRTRPPYGKIFLTFARNSLVRDMSFRTNFILQTFSSLGWAMMNLIFFRIIFMSAKSMGEGTGWNEFEFYVFLATVWIINSIVQTFFMPNAQEFSELIRTGNLDFALLKPIDTQFLISFTKMNWASLANLFAGIALLVVGIWNLMEMPDNPLVLSPVSILMYLFFVACGAAVMYSLVLAVAATSVWLGRNQNVYMLYFYLTQFYRYPMEIYQRGWGWGLWGIFTFLIPVLVVANIPARIMARPLRPNWQTWELGLIGFTLLATGLSLICSRWVFKTALKSYRSASS